MSDYDKIANLEEVIAKKDAEIASLKDKNTEAFKAVLNRDKEIAKLRALVKDLTDALNHELEIGCVRCMASHSSNKCPHAACDRNENRALVAKAREAVK